MSALEDTLAWQMQAAGLPAFERELTFHRGRRWRFDFTYRPAMLAVEVQGGIYSGGRHTTGAGYERDAEKLNQAAIDGWRVLYVTGPMIRDGRALDTVMRALGAS